MSSPETVLLGQSLESCLPFLTKSFYRLSSYTHLILVDMCISVPSPPAIPPPDSCPLNNLLPELKLEILKQLEFSEYRNLAFTCRLWYNTASTAPHPVKPTVVSTELLIHSQSILHPDYTPDFSLINKWKCRYLTVRNHRLLFLKFVEKHHQIFDIGCIVVEHPILYGEVIPVMCSLLRLTSEVVISNLSGASWYVLKELTMDCFLEEDYFHHTVIVNYCPLLVRGAKDVLEQWVQGKRPNLQIYKAVLEDLDFEPHGVSVMDYITSDIRQFVMNRTTETIDDVIREHVKIVVPELPPMFVCTYELTVVISRSLSDNNPSIMKEIEGRLHERATCDEGIDPPTLVIWPFNINYV